MFKQNDNQQRNPYGYGTNEWYEWEAKQAGFKNPQEHMRHEYKMRPRCPMCGIPSGFAFGTGDCNCLDD